LGQLASGTLEALGDLAHGTALAGSFIDGSATAATQAAQSQAGRTGGVGYGTAARSSGASGHAALLSERAIRTHGRAIEPRLIEEFARLHVESDGDEAGIAECVGGGTSAVATAKVAGDALETQNQDEVAIAAVAFTIAVMTSIAEGVAIPIAIAVTILRGTILLLLGSGQRSHRNHQQNCQQGKDASGSILP
jgi:hypothetical protein